MIPRTLFAAAALALALSPAALWAAPAPPEPAPAEATDAAKTPLAARAEEVVALLNGKVGPEALFTAGFLRAVPPAQLKGLIASLTAQFGPALSVAELTPREGARAALAIRFARGLAKGGIAIDPGEDNKVSELLFTAIEPVAVAGDTPEAIVAELAALPGSVNAWFAPLDGGAPVVAHNPDTPLALGSAFKLYILAALAEEVKAGQRKWSDVVRLGARSYPSGRLQDWPGGAPLTLHTLASLMISVSDNTATDQLIATLGRERILKAMKDSGHANPSANDPFLTTRELFLLKSLKNEEIAGRGARALLADPAIATFLASGDPPLETITAGFAQGPKALQLEWFASPADLARLFAHMRRTADPEAFRIMAINPSASPGIKARWPYIGFKGGSEPGVLNLTWLLRDEAGRDWVLSLGWNNPAAAVDEGRLEGIAQRILLLPR